MYYVNYSYLRDRIYLFLLCYYNEKELPTYVKLARKCGYSRQTISKKIKELQDAEIMIPMDDGKYLFMATAKGMVKKTPIKDYENVRKNGLAAINLREDDTLIEVKVTDNSEDIAPEIGYGRIVTKIYKGVKSYKVEFLPRIQITKITADRKTKGESLEYNTVSIEANVMELEEEINGMKIGDWKKVKSFTTLAEAQTYLDGLLIPIPVG